MSWIIDLIAKLFGLWVNKRPEIAPVAEKLGQNEQALKDQGAAYDELAKAAAARADADTQRVLRNPDAGKVDPDAAKHFPGVEFRD